MVIRQAKGDLEISLERERRFMKLLGDDLDSYELPSCGPLCDDT